MGPYSGLSLRGGTGYPAPHWNLDIGCCNIYYCSVVCLSDTHALCYAEAVGLNKMPFGRDIHPRFILKIFYAGCLGLSPVILVQFTLAMCIAV